MNKKMKKTISKYLPIALIAMLLVPMNNSVLADDPTFNFETPPVPEGMTITSSRGELNNPLYYGFTDPNGFNDGFQWRQSIVTAVLPFYNTSNSRLNGYRIQFIIYCPVIPQTHTMSVLGDVVYVFDDDTTRVDEGGFTATWTSYGIQSPLLIWFEIGSRWTYKTCKNIYVSFDYCEDGQFIRHIEKSWINRPHFDSVNMKMESVASQIAD